MKPIKINQHPDFRFFIIMMVFLFIQGCYQEQSDSISHKDTNQELPVQEGWNSTLRISKEGRLQTLVAYGHMAQYQNKKTIYFDGGITIDFFNESQKPSSQLTSDRGIYYENTEDVVALGHVVVTSDTGVTLRTSQLRWDNRLEKILSDTTVMVTTQDQDTIYGMRFESEPDLSSWIIHEPWGVSHQSIELNEFFQEREKTDQNESMNPSNSTSMEPVKESLKSLEVEDHEK